VFTQNEPFTVIYTAYQDGHSTSNIGHIVRSENVGSVWECLELMWCRLWGFIL